MKIEFIANASCIFKTSQGTKILCDPWLVDGVFEGSWCHYPKLKTTFDDVQDVDAIYLSHLHPDHYDERYFDFRKNMPIFALNHGAAFLIQMLKRKGYTNIIEIKDQETIQFKDCEVTLFAPYTKHNFHEAEVGNLIDSAMALKADGKIALNSNDNMPTPETCLALNKRFGHIDLAMLKYNAAGPYPSCFDNLSPAEKKQEHDRIIKRNLNYLVSLIEAMKPTYVLPFAGAYVIGGKEFRKNECLGTTTLDGCIDFLKSHLKCDARPIALGEGDELDLKTGIASPYRLLDEKDMNDYIVHKLSKLPYPYEEDAAPEMDRLKKDVLTASEKMRSRMDRFGLKPKMKVLLNLDDEQVCIYEPPVTPSEGTLTCSLDLRLLRRILDRKANWNNAEVGCHVNFIRTPNHYDPDLHTSLQFLHL